MGEKGNGRKNPDVYQQKQLREETKKTLMLTDT